MAKSNGFFSLRRGSTKSLTFSVLNGKQITKDRVTSVRNPRSSKQQYQRAIMATIMAAYSKMKAIEDHAFEGKSVGFGNQREFMKLNLNKLRAAMVSDYENNRAAVDCTAFVKAPKVNDIVANSYVISRGSLPSQNLFRITEVEIEDGAAELEIIPSEIILDAETPTCTVQQFLEFSNLQPGSIITFAWIDLGFGGKRSYGSASGWSYIPGKFQYKRFIVKKDVDLTHTFTKGQNQTDLSFIVSILQYIADGRSNVEYGQSAFADNDGVIVAKLEDFLGLDAAHTGAFGVITSVEDTDLRDNADMYLYDREDNLTAKNTGLTWGAVPTVWRTGLTPLLGDSDLYLEGGE